ncbi:MAG TPA: hypothetical protein VHD36_04605 [Pirellulales bacterium]|nr:hypothetical protein [Pirellulales bacterium]
MSNSATAQSVLDREFLELRARILELGAALDRLDRAGGPPANDPRMAAIGQALDVLRAKHAHGAEADRAEQVQLIFSIPYDEAWRTTLGVRPR